jgi:hypothetical protein
MVMTNNEKVKQAINKNMDSIYSALEHVGATLPKKKNLENISKALTDLNYTNFIDLLTALNLINTHMWGTSSKTSFEINNEVLEILNFSKLHLGGT